MSAAPALETLVCMVPKGLRAGIPLPTEGSANNKVFAYADVSGSVSVEYCQGLRVLLKASFYRCQRVTVPLVHALMVSERI